MKALIAWVNSPEAQTLDPVIEAGIAHYEFVRIHPFVDGNGRTARVLATLILYLRGFDAKQFFCLDDYYPKCCIKYDADILKNLCKATRFDYDTHDNTPP